MLKERWLSLREIASKVKEPVSTVTRYWREWTNASEEDRALARSGTKLERRTSPSKGSF